MPKPLFHHAVWTPQLVFDYLEEAAETLRRLPAASIRNKLTSWPDVVLSQAEILLGSPKERLPLPPSPQAIDRMDEVLAWLLPLNAEERRILWARASHVRWRKIEALDGRSHVTLRRIFNDALQKIVCARMNTPTGKVIPRPSSVVVLY